MEMIIEKTIKLVLLLGFVILYECNSQDALTIKPKQEVSFELGTKGYFEKDLQYIKTLLDNDSYRVNNYSFLPKMIWSTKELVIFFDRYSGNLITFNINTNKAQNIQQITEKIHQATVPKEHNIDLIDLRDNLLVFYDNKKNMALLYSLDTGSEYCRISMESIFGIRFEKETDTLRIFSHEVNVNSIKCKEPKVIKHESIPINDSEVFLRYDDSLFYQTTSNNKIQIIDLTKASPSLSKISLSEKIPANYNLIHVNSKFYVFASNFERGLGEFMFLDKKSGGIIKRIIIDKSILDSSLIDFYDAFSDYPSPDVDDPNSYVRMTSIGARYFILFQTKGKLNLYSFTI